MSLYRGALAPDTAHEHSSLRRFAVPLICVAQLMATLDVTIVNLALPSIQHDLSLSNAGLAWVIDAYTLSYAGLLLAGGRAGDLFGQRRTLMVGIGLFTGSSVLAGLATDTAALLASRAGQGIGAALATPTTLSLITTLCPPGARRVKAMVAYGAMSGVGITLGLVLGGILTEAASWRWVFLVNVPMGVFVLTAAPRVLPEARGGGRRIDVLGALTGTATLGTLVFGVIRAGTHHWGERISVASLLSSIALLVVFVAVESRVVEPMLPLRLLQHRVRLSAYLVSGFLFACLYPTFFLSSRALQDVRGLGPVQAGLQYLPLGGGVLLFAVVARSVMSSTRAPVLVLCGTATASLGAGALTFYGTTSGYLTLLLPALLGIGAGVGTTFVANASLAMTDVPEQDAGIAAGLLSTFQIVGGTIGVAALAAVAATRTQARLETAVLPLTRRTYAEALLSGFGLGFAIAAVLALVAFGIAAITVLRPPARPV